MTYNLWFNPQTATVLQLNPLLKMSTNARQTLWKWLPEILLTGNLRYTYVSVFSQNVVSKNYSV